MSPASVDADGKGTSLCLTAAWSKPGRLERRAMTTLRRHIKNHQYLPETNGIIFQDIVTPVKSHSSLIFAVIFASSWLTMLRSWFSFH